MRWIRQSIALRLTLLVVLGAGTVLAAVVGASYVVSRRLLEDELCGRATALARSAAGRIESVAASVEGTADALGGGIERLEPRPEGVYDLLEAGVARNADLFGLILGVEPYALGFGREAFAPAVFRNGEGLKKTDLAAERVRYRVEDWYALGRFMGEPQWSDPYYGEGGRTLLATYAVPVRDVLGRVRAVLGGEVSLAWLTDLLASLPGPGRAFLLSSTGTYIAHSDHGLIMNETVFSLAEADGDPGLRMLGRRMTGGEEGFVPFTVPGGGEDGWLAFSPVPRTGWSLAVFFPQRVLFARIMELSRVQATIAFAGFAVILLVALLISRSLSRPLVKLEGAAQAVAAGNLEVSLPPVRSGDEVGRLTAAFGTMQGELKRTMATLEETAAARERIESELRIARSIQMGLVPKTFPPFPKREDLDLYALLEPAREVGGDFYDFFLLEDHQLCLVAGDVSGKGVPAALFMAVVRTFIRAMARDTASPGELMRRVNDEMAEQNDSCMFVTLFFGLVDLNTGDFSYALGGHEPPIRVAEKGETAPLETLDGALVGVMDGVDFAESSMRLDPGDVLVLFTDGVTEAMNHDQELYDRHRLLEAVNSADGTAEDYVSAIRADVARFVDGAEQSDDITLLVFRYLGH